MQVTVAVINQDVRRDNERSTNSSNEKMICQVHLLRCIEYELPGQFKSGLFGCQLELECAWCAQALCESFIGFIDFTLWKKCPDY